MAGAVEKLFVELERFFEPLSRALATPEEFAAFLRRFGLAFDDANVGGPFGQLAAVRASILDLQDATETALADGLSAADLVTIATAAAPAFQSIAHFEQSLSGLPAPNGLSASDFAAAIEAVAEELFDALLTDYLSANAPLALHSLVFLDVVATEAIPASGDPRSRGLAYVRTTYRWDRIGLLFDDASQWAAQAYGWGTNFDSDRFIFRLTKIFEYLGGIAEVREMSEAQAAVFMPQAATLPVKPHMALAPIRRGQSIVAQPDGTNALMSNEVGLAILPVDGVSGPADKGIGVAPYTEGTIAADIPIKDTLDLKLTGNIGALGGVVFSFRPSGATHDIGIDAAAFNGDFTAELIVHPKAGQNTIVLIGDPASTRVEIDAVLASAGGSASNSGAEFFVAAGVKALHVVVDASSDGLLGAILGGPIEVSAGDLLVGWRSGRGLYFEGGTGVSVKIPIDKQIGPFHLYDIGIALDWKDALAATGTVTADAKLGPLYAYVEGLGLTATLVPKQNGDGALGKFDIAFGLKLPTAYAVALDAAPISGGGFLAIMDNEYRGALALKFETFGFAAFAILTTKLPGGRSGFSFVASIFGDFVIPLGYGFFLTGLGGMIAINRTVNSDALRDVLYRGELDSILFPDDPIVNAATILDNMAAIFPAREGQYVFGPMARIAFSQPALIEGKLGLVLEVGSEFRLLVLGGLGSHLPTADAPLVVLEVSFFGEIDFGAGTISFDATLQNSRVLAWSVSGDMAARTGWAPRINHVISFGGLHPRYPRPANLPDLRRMSINFGTNNPRVSIWSYQAVTLNSLQFGAGGDLYAKGPKIPFVGRLAAEGHAYFDALIYFNPFAFDAGLGGSLSLLVDGDVVMSLGFDLHLTGPNEFVIDGKVWATVCGVDVDFGIHHRWGDKRDLPNAVADPIAILRDAIHAAPTLEAIPATALSDGVRFAGPARGDDRPRPTSPVGGLRFNQRAMPLAIAIEKIGEADIPGAPRTFDFGVYAGATNDEITTVPAELDFVHGHFWKTSEAERLRSPTFEQHKSGFEIASSDQLTVDVSKAIDVEYGYEYMMIGDEATPQASFMLPFATLTDSRFAQWMDAHHRETTAPIDRAALVRAALDAPTVTQPGFTPTETPQAQPFFTAKEAAMTRPERRRNPVVADYVALRN
jgi:hypothetical protein